MAIRLADESKTQGMPAAEEKTPPEGSRASNRGARSADTPAGNIANAEAWAAWEAKGKGSSRPPWWLLLLGVLALGAVYWMTES